MLPKYTINSLVYYVIYANCRIIPVTVKDVYLATVNFQSSVRYDLQRVDTGAIIQDASEAELFTFAEAKINLLGYLNNKITEVTNMTA